MFKQAYDVKSGMLAFVSGQSGMLAFLPEQQIHAHTIKTAYEGLKC